MFNKQAFIQATNGISDTGLYNFFRYPGIHYVTYPHYSFVPPDGEQFIRITRAPKKPGDSGLAFWIASEFLDGWDSQKFKLPQVLNYLGENAFEEIDEATFDKMVKDASADLIVPILSSANVPQTFQGAMMMRSMKTEFTISLFAEYANEFVHFYWTTTA
jgi:hypothetical protein